jgi:N-acetylglutamate synthase-like GNAT family acetyltransferase
MNNQVSYILRTANKEDSSTIYRIWKEVWLKTYVNETFNITETDIGSKFKDKEAFINEISSVITSKDNYTWVTEYNNEILGFVIVESKKEAFRIRALYVRQKGRGKGMGGGLIRKVLSEIKGKGIYVDVPSFNDIACSFFEKYGFERSMDENISEKLPSGKKINMIRMIYKSS